MNADPAREALEAAFEIVKAIDYATERQPTRKLVAALAAINDVTSKAQLPTENEIFDSLHILASAMHAAGEGCFAAIDKVDPHCVGAAPFIAFAKLCLAAEATGSAEAFLDDDYPICGAEELAKALTVSKQLAVTTAKRR